MSLAEYQVDMGEQQEVCNRYAAYLKCRINFVDAKNRLRTSILELNQVRDKANPTQAEIDYITNDWQELNQCDIN